jgi:hypothetical protein
VTCNPPTIQGPRHPIPYTSAPNKQLAMHDRKATITTSHRLTIGQHKDDLESVCVPANVPSRHRQTPSLYAPLPQGSGGKKKKKAHRHLRPKNRDLEPPKGLSYTVANPISRAEGGPWRGDRPETGTLPDSGSTTACYVKDWAVLQHVRHCTAKSTAGASPDLVQSKCTVWGSLPKGSHLFPLSHPPS